MVARLTGEIASRARSPPPAMHGLVVRSSATFWRSAPSWPIASWTEDYMKNRQGGADSALGGDPKGPALRTPPPPPAAAPPPAWAPPGCLQQPRRLTSHTPKVGR